MTQIVRHKLQEKSRAQGSGQRYNNAALKNKLAQAAAAIGTAACADLAAGGKHNHKISVHHGGGEPRL